MSKAVCVSACTLIFTMFSCSDNIENLTDNGSPLTPVDDSANDKQAGEGDRRDSTATNDDSELNSPGDTGDLDNRRDEPEFTEDSSSKAPSTDNAERGPDGSESSQQTTDGPTDTTDTGDSSSFPKNWILLGREISQQVDAQTGRLINWLTYGKHQESLFYPHALWNLGVGGRNSCPRRGRQRTPLCGRYHRNR